MADPTQPPGGGAPSSAPSAFLNAESFAALRDVEQRLKSLEQVVEQFGGAKAAEVSEKVLTRIRQLKEEAGPQLGAASEYFRKYAADMETIGNKLERDLEDSTKAIVQSLDEQKKALIKQFETYNKDLPKSEESIKKFNEIIQRLGDAKNVDALANINHQMHQLFTELVNPSKKQQETWIEDLIKKVDEIDNGKGDFVKKLKKIKELFASTPFALEGPVNSAKDFREAIDNLKASITSNPDAIVGSLKVYKEFMDVVNAGKLARFNEINDINARAAAELRVQELLQFASKEELKLNEIRKINANAQKELNSEMGRFVDKLLGASKSTNGFGSALIAMRTASINGKGAIAGLTDAIFTGLSESFLKPEAAANRLFNFLNDKLIKSAFEFDKMVADLNKQTGGLAAGFEKVAFAEGGLFKASSVGYLAQYGMGIKEFSESYATLAKSVGNFNNMSDASRKILALNATELKNLGVSAENYGKLVQTFMGTFGQSAEIAKDSINKVARDAIALGKDIGEYTTQLQNSMSKLVGYGREATQVFKELTAVSQATKGVLQATDLTALADQFATFDTAAAAVANLNVMMRGTALSSLDLMGKDPSEVIMKIKRAATDSGLEFDKLNIGYKKMLAGYFGGDVAKAAAFFNMNLKEAEEQMRNAAATEEELTKKKEASAAAQAKLTAAINNMKVALTPIVDAVSVIAKGFMAVNDKFGPFGTFIVGLTPLVFGVIGAFKAFQFAGVNAVAAIIAKIEEARLKAANLKRELGAAPPASGLPAVPGAPAGPGFFARNMGVIGGIVGTAAILSMLASSNKDSDVRGGDIIFRSMPDGSVQKLAEVASNDVVDVRAGYSGGPIDRASGFISSTFRDRSNSSLSNSESSSIFVGLKESLVQTVNSIKELTNFSKLTQISSDRNTMIAKESLESNKISEANSRMVSAAMTQSTVEKQSNSLITREVGGTTNTPGTTNIVNQKSSALPEKVNLHATFNINMKKMVDEITEEVAAKLSSKV